MVSRLKWVPLSSTLDSRYFLAGYHRASPMGGFCDTTSSSLAWDGARRLGEATSPSTTRYDDGVSSSTALAVFSGRASSSMGWKRLFLLWVVKGRRAVC